MSDTMVQTGTDAAGSPIWVPLNTANPLPVAGLLSGPVTVVTTLTTLEAGHVLKATAGNLYSVYVTNTNTIGGYLIITNTATVEPTSTASLGSGVIMDVIYVGQTATDGVNYAPGPPEAFSTGCSAVFSSTAPPVVTQLGSCWFNGHVA